MPTLRYLDTRFIREGLNRLAQCRVHPLVGLFLDISRYRISHGITESSLGAVNLPGLDPDYKLEGGPAGKPLFIPFRDRNRNGIQGFFRNGNLSGSWAPASMRKKGTGAGLVDDNDHYCYPSDPTRFLDERMDEPRPQLWAVASFYLRDATFSLEGSHDLTAKDLTVIFRKMYGLMGINAFDDSMEEAPESVFIPAPADVEPTSKGEAIQLEDGLTVTVYPRTRRPNITANDIVEDDKKPADSVKEIDAERMMREYGGLILVGPPGTSKSYTAQIIADRLTGADESCQFYTQFHASYQYEDFIEGYHPTVDGGFERYKGVFLQACDKARTMLDDSVVLVIDEISRADVGRVFGEALTYIETTKRGMSFILPSGETTSVPKNLLIIATMNSLDRGANDIDEAFGRRFAFMEVPPDPDKLTAVMPDDVDKHVFDSIRRWMEIDLEAAKDSPRAAIGHAFFSGIKTDDDAKRRWHYQIDRYLAHALTGQPDILARLRGEWEKEFPQDSSL